MQDSTSRRRFVAIAGTAITAAVAGCPGDDGGAVSPDGTAAGTEPGGVGGETEADTPMGGDETETDMETETGTETDTPMDGVETGTETDTPMDGVETGTETDTPMDGAETGTETPLSGEERGGNDTGADDR